MKQLIPLLSSMSICAVLLCLCLLLLPMQSQPTLRKQPKQLSYPMEQLDKLIFQDFTLLNTGSRLVLMDLEQLPLQESRTEALLALLADCTGESLPIPDKAPAASLRLQMVDGQQQHLSLYNVESGFVLSDGDAAVALTDEEAQPLLWQAEDYAPTQILSLTLPAEGHFLLSGKLHPEPLQFSYYIEESEAVALLTAPHTADISKEKLAPLLSSLCQLQAVQVAALAPDSVDLQRCGLSAPFCVLQGDLQGQSFTLSASQPDESGRVYLMKEGTPLIYEAHLSQLPWLSACKESLTEENLFSPDYEDCTGFTLSTAVSQYHFSKWAGQVLCKGRSVNERDFYHLYRLASTLIPSKAALFPPQGDALLQITFSYTNPARAKDHIVFYPYDEENLLLSLNGDSRFLMEKEQAEEIIAMADSIP